MQSGFMKDNIHLALFLTTINIFLGKENAVNLS